MTTVRPPLGIRARPLDFYVAFLVFFIDAYGFLDPNWPEQFETPIYWIVIIEDVYLMLASSSIMTALIVKQFFNKKSAIVIGAIIAEMFGWVFISAAATVIVLTSWWIPPAAVQLNYEVQLAWILLWIGLAISSGMRYLDLRFLYRGSKDE